MKKHLRHTGSVVRMGVEIAGIIGLCLVVAWLALLWRLSQGPLQVNFLADKLQQEISRKAEGYQVTFGSASLSWNGGFSPILINVNNVDILRTDGTPVLHVADMGIGLSQKKLLMGQLSLKKINIFKPAIRIIRWEDGQVTLNNEEAPVADVESARTGQTETMALLTAYLNGEKSGEIPALSIIEGLRELSMTHAGILYEDRILKTTLISRNANISVSRKSSEGIKARFNIIIDAPTGGVQGYVSGSYRYDAVGINKARVSFRDINPAQIGLSGETADIMSGIDLPMKGIVDLGFYEDMSVSQASFAFGAGEGHLRINDLYSEPLPIKSIFVRGAVQPREKTGQIERAEIAFADGPKAEAVITSKAGDGDLRTITIDAILHAMPIDKLKFYWPEKLTPDPRAWVTQHLSKGIADKATLHAVLSYDETAEQKIAPVDIGGNIDFHGIDVDYFPPLRVVTDAKGRATYDMKSFNLDISGGKLDDIIVTKSKINITGLDEQNEHTDSRIDIDVDMKGPLKTALMVLDSKPLQYPSMLGIKTDGVQGQSDISVNFKFPLNKNLAVEQVQVSAKAKADQVLLKSIVSGLDISGGPMDLTVSNGALHVAGKASLGDMPVDFDWTKNFSGKTSSDMDLTAKISLSPAGLQSFGLPPEIALTGNLPSSVSYHLNKNGDAQLKLSSNIMTPAISIPSINAQKPAGAPGSLDATLVLKKERLVAVRDLNMTSDALTLRGDVDFDVSRKDTMLNRVNLPMVKLGDTDIMVRAEKSNNYLTADISGRQLDASVFFPENPPPNSDEEASKQVQPLRLKMNVAKLITGEKRMLENVNLTLERNNWNRFDRVDMYGNAGGGPVTVKYLPEGMGKKLSVTAQNAGAALYALGITKSVRGGKLAINAKTPAGGGVRDLKGSVQITNFGLKDAPLVAKLLNAMSLSGIQALLTGEGVQFKKAKVDFSWIDRGQPGQAQNVRLLKLKDGQTSGSSLGLTFEGTIDNWKNIYDLYGTIVPVSDINKFLNVVPLIGNVLTAGGEGIIAATYKITGPQDQPSISVNPLAVLAPGILRKIFFE